MTRKVAKHHAAAKSADSQIRNQNSQIRNQISPVMLAVKALLPAQKAAWHLAILIDEPLSTCQKLLCGERDVNASIQTKMLRTEQLGSAVLDALMEPAEPKPDWYVRHRQRNEVAQARKLLKALEARAFE